MSRCAGNFHRAVAGPAQTRPYTVQKRSGGVLRVHLCDMCRDVLRGLVRDPDWIQEATSPAKEEIPKTKTGLSTRRAWLKTRALAAVHGGVGVPFRALEAPDGWTPPAGAFNGPLLSLVKVSRGPRLHFAPSSYFNYLLEKERGLTFGYKDLLWPRWNRTLKVGLNLATVVHEGHESYVLVGKRSEKLAEYPGKWHVLPAGTVGMGGLWETMKKETLEEIGIDVGLGLQSIEAYYTGLFLDSVAAKVEATGCLNLRNHSAPTLLKLAEGAKDRQEHTELRVLSLDNGSWDLEDPRTWIPAGLEAIRLARAVVR